jgi:hypothetical protein
MTIEWQNKKIRSRFRIRYDDNLPMIGWGLITRDRIYELFKDFDYKIGAEIGVRKGENAYSILDKNPQIKLILVDPWKPFHRTSQRRQNQYYRYTIANLNPFKDRIYIKKMDSMEASTEVDDNSLDFVYIDGMHEFEYVIEDLIEWNKKVRIGGMISGHDYYHEYQQGVVQAVDAFTYAHGITQWYITTEEHPSYFWIKPN